MDNPIFNFLLMLVPLVVIHELGHFIMAKLGGIRVTSFAIGFGKKLFGFTYKGTEYCWNLLPLGGYVNFMGEVGYTNEIPNDPQHFYNRPKWIRFLVLVMGPLFNVILAFAVFWIFRGSNPTLIDVFKDPLFTVGYVEPQSVEAQAGLLPGDRIVALDNDPVTSVDQLYEWFALNPNREVVLHLVRDDREMELSFKIPEHKVEGYGLVNFGHSQRMMVSSVQDKMPAQLAGIQKSDVVTRVNGRPVRLVPRDYFAQMIQLAARGQVLVKLRAPDGSIREVDFSQAEDSARNFGLTLEQTDNGGLITAIAPGSSSENAGLNPGDLLFAVNGKTLNEVGALPEMVADFLSGKMVLDLVRDEKELSVVLAPELVEDRYLLGIAYGGEYRVQELTWGAAFIYAGRDIARWSTLIFEGVKKMVSGQLSVKTLSGPVGVGRAANQAAQMGFWSFMFLMAVLSLNLGILNLLPIPVLDGGEIFVLLVEWISRKDFSLDTKMKIKMVGFVFIVGLMGVVIVNDVIKVFSSPG